MASFVRPSAADHKKHHDKRSSRNRGTMPTLNSNRASMSMMTQLLERGGKVGARMQSNKVECLHDDRDDQRGDGHGRTTCTPKSVLVPSKMSSKITSDASSKKTPLPLATAVATAAHAAEDDIDDRTSKSSSVPSSSSTMSLSSTTPSSRGGDRDVTPASAETLETAKKSSTLATASTAVVDIGRVHGCARTTQTQSTQTQTSSRTNAAAAAMGYGGAAAVVFAANHIGTSSKSPKTGARGGASAYPPDTASLNSLIDALMQHYHQPRQLLSPLDNRSKGVVCEQQLQSSKFGGQNPQLVVDDAWANPTSSADHHYKDSRMIASCGTRPSNINACAAVDHDQSSLPLIDKICSEKISMSTTSAAAAAAAVASSAASIIPFVAARKSLQLHHTEQLSKDTPVDKGVTRSSYNTSTNLIGGMAKLQHPAIALTHDLVPARKSYDGGSLLSRPGLGMAGDATQKQDHGAHARQILLRPSATATDDRDVIGQAAPYPANAGAVSQLQHVHRPRQQQMPLPLYSHYMRDAYTEVSPSVSCRRDMGTQVTPHGGSQDSSCRRTTTPPKGRNMNGGSSPARHNTPAKMRTTPIAGVAEEEEEISKGLPDDLEFVDLKEGVTVDDAATIAWQEATRLKVIARFESEELKIRAWEEHQAAKAEAELKKLQVKLEKKKIQATQKIANKLESVRRRAEFLRAAAKANQMQASQKTCEHANRIRQEARATFPLCACLSSQLHHL